MPNDDEVKLNGERKITVELRSEVRKYDWYRDGKMEFLQRRFKFDDLCIRRLRHIIQAKHQVELTSKDVAPVYSAPYRMDPTDKQFLTERTKKLL